MWKKEGTGGMTFGVKVEVVKVYRESEGRGHVQYTTRTLCTVGCFSPHPVMANL